MHASVPAEIAPLLRVVLATVLGGAVGWEREHIDRPAGLRTHMTVALAAALFTGLAVRLAETSDIGGIDPARALQAVVTGVSFLGAGTIFSARAGSTVKGLTTAASLLATAGIGVATALASYVMAVGATALLLVVLGLVRRIEGRAGPPRPRPDARARSRHAAPNGGLVPGRRWHRDCFSSARRSSRRRRERTADVAQRDRGEVETRRGRDTPPVGQAHR